MGLLAAVLYMYMCCVNEKLLRRAVVDWCVRVEFMKLGDCNYQQVIHHFLVSDIHVIYIQRITYFHVCTFTVCACMYVHVWTYSTCKYMYIHYPLTRIV